VAFDDLKQEQQLAIELMVMGDPDLPGRSLKYKEIAERCGVAEYTLRRWRHDPRFQEAKKEFREKIAKSTLVDEAIQTLRRSMRSKDSTHAAEVVLKFAGEMVNINKTESDVKVTQQIDLKGADTQTLLAKLQELHKQLGLPENIHLYIGQGEVVDGQVVEQSDSAGTTEHVDDNGK
jgi:transcriptional regulator with XRE-family HTH domain